MGERQGVSLWSAGDSFRPQRTCAPFCLLFQDCLLPISLLPSQRKHISLTSERVPGEICARHSFSTRVETKSLFLQRGVHVLYLQCGSLQTHTQICLPHSRARDEFYLYHLGEPVPNEKKKKKMPTKLRKDIHPLARVSRDGKSKQNKWMCCKNLYCVLWCCLNLNL